jgi:hypothetical protein
MELMFESILLFSLAVLVIAIGLMVYYFKNRIVEIEQKNTKCLEIVHDVFLQHIQLKAEVSNITEGNKQEDIDQQCTSQQCTSQQRTSQQCTSQYNIYKQPESSINDTIMMSLDEEGYNTNGECINGECINGECINGECINGECINGECTTDPYYETDDESDYEDDVKIVNMNLSGPIDSDINISDEIDDQYNELLENDEIQCGLLENYELQGGLLHLCTSKTPTLSADLSDKGNSYHALEKCEGVENDDITVTESTTITKIDVNDSDLESDSEKSVSKSNEAFRELFNPDTKDSYKKMDIKALRRLVVTRGLATENTSRMKKNELIDILLTIV